MNKFILMVTPVVLTVASLSTAFADCEPNYGGGETCIVNKSFKIIKEVRIEGQGDFRDKVVDVKKDDTVEFRIRIKNNTDDAGLDDISFDNMKMKDILPSEMYRTGGAGLTEYWNDFEPGETKEFIIKAKVNASEYDRKNFEKCVVNKAEAYYNDNFEGADTAVVCYKEGNVTELPETGASTAISFIGLGLAALGKKLKTYL